MTEQAAPARQQGRSRPRSPSYPGIDLATAIERARTMFDHEQRNAAHVDVLYHHWGHSPKSGAGGVVLAALKKYGLISDEGAGANRRAHLTDTALDILLDDAESPTRQALIRDAALKPAIHQEVWSKYAGSLPSDQSLRMWLIRDKAFTSSGADEFIAQLRRTLAFASTPSSDKIVAPEHPQETSEAMPPQSSNVTTQIASQKYQVDPSGRPSVAIQLPLGVGFGWASLDAPFPLTEQAWALMLRVLEAMKPGLVRPDSASPPPDSDIEGESNGGLT
jgi:hypothetical protein